MSIKGLGRSLDAEGLFFVDRLQRELRRKERDFIKAKAAFYF